MKIKQLFLFAASVICLSSCSSQNNSSNTKQTDDSNKVPISQLWDGYEELQGKQYGNAFTLPEKIEPTENDGIYSLTLVPRIDIDPEAASQKLFKAVYGNVLDDKNLSASGDGTYTYKDADGVITSFANNAPASIGYTKLPLIGGTQYEETAVYDPVKDADVFMELELGSCTVGELWRKAMDSAELYFSGYYPGLELCPGFINYMHDTDLDEYRAYLQIDFSYKGIPFQDVLSGLFETEDRGFYKVLTSYGAAFIGCHYYGINDPALFMFYYGAYNIVAEEQENIIPFRDAVGIMEKELAPNMKLKFENVSMQYCHKNISPVYTADSELNERIRADFGEELPLDFRPTWVFSWTETGANGKEQDYVKVDAISGEITIDK